MLCFNVAKIFRMKKAIELGEFKLIESGTVR